MRHENEEIRGSGEEGNKFNSSLERVEGVGGLKETGS